METKKAFYGFDLTDFGGNWPMVVQKTGVVYVGKTKLGFMFQSSTGLIIETANNPYTGQFRKPDSREYKIGYASYIGIEGSESEVEWAVSVIKSFAVYTKGFSEGSRDYI